LGSSTHTAELALDDEEIVAINPGGAMTPEMIVEFPGTDGRNRHTEG